MVFGQVVIGPPGSGKSTYCEGMRQYLETAGRSVSVVNLDPANDLLPYEPAADIRELVSVEGAASACGLGPNGALVYCLEYLEANLDWLEGALSRAGSASYVLLDLPGQVELYTHYPVVRNVLQGLQRRGHRLCCVHLVDAHHPRSGIRDHVSRPAPERTRAPLHAAVFGCTHCTQAARTHPVL